MNANGAIVELFLPKRQWDYLRWLISQGFDLNQFTKTCDQHRIALDGNDIPFSDYVSFAVDRLHRLHYRQHADGDNLVQPVFPDQIAAAIAKADAYFRKSGSNPMRWQGWTA